MSADPGEAILTLSIETLTHDPYVQAALTVCAERGIAACLVGGAVRDLLLGRPIHDWDWVVERDAISLARATADRLGAAFFPLDQEHDTGRVVIRDADGSRTFLDFALRRGPDWHADLEARDLTVNAMAVPLTGDVSTIRQALLDPFGGQSDLQVQLIRAVTERSFRDDPVRTMRAVRLAGELGFQIEPQTAAWIRRDAPLLLAQTSAERVRDELGKLLAQPDALARVRQIDDLGLLAPVLPEVAALRGVDQSRPHHWPVLEHTLFVLAALERIVAESIYQAQETGRTRGAEEIGAPAFVWSDITRILTDLREPLAMHLDQPLGSERPVLVSLKLAVLLHDSAKPQTKTLDESDRTHFYGHEDAGASIAAERVRALRFNNAEVERVRTVVANHMRPQQVADAESGVTRRAAYRYFRDTREAGVDVLLLALADHIATHGPDVQRERWERRIDTVSRLLAEYWARLAKDVAPPPLVSGDDLMTELDLSPGKHIGELLEAIREAQAAGEIVTRRDALELAKRTLAKV
jgi:tRNA nucleotidyltransferase/poly(A) polymerase